MIEQFRNMIAVELENRIRKSVEDVAQLTYYTSAQRGDGQMIPGTSLEAIGVQTIAHNARTRALHEALMIVQSAYKQINAPAQQPKDAAEKAQEAPYA